MTTRNTAPSTDSSRQSSDLGLMLDLTRRYFDCTLSEEEERRFIRLLAETPLRHPALDEAIAVIGMRHPSCRACVERRPRSGFFRNAAVKAAAAAALLAGIAIGGISLSRFPAADYGAFSDGTSCIAYTGGQRLTDEEQVIELLRQQLSDFDEECREQTEDLAGEFSDACPVIEQSADLSILLL